MTEDIYQDILWKLRIPLPYELRGLTVSDLIDERKRAADEIERLRARLATAERHLRIVSVHRGTPAANRILDYWLPLADLAKDALDD